MVINTFYINMKIIEIEGKKYKLTEVKEEKKNYWLFTLSMPNVGSWNGKWTGDKISYTRTKKAISYNKKIYPNLTEGDFYYNFGDGWGANVNVKLVTLTEAKKSNKTTKGFCGYEWMIDSLINNGKILI